MVDKLILKQVLAVPCSRRLILTNDESATIEDDYGVIQVMPVWKWLLGIGK